MSSATARPLLPPAAPCGSEGEQLILGPGPMSGDTAVTRGMKDGPPEKSRDRKTAFLQDAGGGTRTPDTRIMIPLL